MRLAILSFVVALSLSCRAEDVVKQGEIGEFCNGADVDCRPGLLCELGECVAGDGPTYDCRAICAKLNECDVALPSCESDCRATTLSWALGAQEEFGFCIVEDIDCDFAESTEPTQYCYSQIPISDDRFAVCDNAARAALDCGTGLEDAEKLLEACAAVARVQPDTVWEDAATCATPIETGICAEVGTCFTGE